MPKKPLDLQAKLKKADPEIRYYVAELERRNAKLQADKIERDNRIKALKQDQRAADLAEQLQRAKERTEPPKVVIQTFSPEAKK